MSLRLPFALDRYFTRPPGIVELPLYALRATRARAKGIENANRFMLMAWEGTMERRKPISVRDNGDGTFDVLDGNSTYANAVASDWPTILAIVE